MANRLSVEDRLRDEIAKECRAVREQMSNLHRKMSRSSHGLDLDLDQIDFQMCWHNFQQAGEHLRAIDNKLARLNGLRDDKRDH